MKQPQTCEVKYPKQVVNEQQKPLIQIVREQKQTAQSQMIRIIIALLIAIFIYNSTQQTTINYNQIIKNQKMFIVKNIRGVIPTLSGDVYKLQNKWKIVHFQNYHQNDSQLLNNYTLTFNSTHLLIQNIECNNTHLVYEWRNYSYNIDFRYTGQSKQKTVSLQDLQLNGLINSNTITNQNNNQANGSTIKGEQANSSNKQVNERQGQVQNQQQMRVIINDTIKSDKQIKNTQINSQNKANPTNQSSTINIVSNDSQQDMKNSNLINNRAMNVQLKEKQQRCRSSVQVYIGVDYIGEQFILVNGKYTSLGGLLYYTQTLLCLMLDQCYETWVLIIKLQLHYKA